jgi:hypothetical protein
VIASDEIRLGNPDPIPLARSASSTAAGFFPSWGSRSPHLTSPTVAAARRMRSAGRLRERIPATLYDERRRRPSTQQCNSVPEEATVRTLLSRLLSIALPDARVVFER